MSEHGGHLAAPTTRLQHVPAVRQHGRRGRPLPARVPAVPEVAQGGAPAGEEEQDLRSGLQQAEAIASAVVGGASWWRRSSGLSEQESV